MQPLRRFARGSLAVPLFAVTLFAVLALGGCKKLHFTDYTPLDQAGMPSNSVDQVRAFKISDAEVQQLAQVRQSGMSDDDCVELVRLAHGHPGGEFADGQAVTGLLGAGVSQSTVLELARLNQLGLWAGEAEALHLANLSDDVILALARRRAAGEPVPSSAKVADLRNAGFSDEQIIDDIGNGTTDEQADAIIAKRNYAAGGHSFVHEPSRRRR